MRGAAAAEPGRVEGPGYALSFVGSQGDAIMSGKRATVLDLGSLRGRPHLYGLGPVEGLTGEVTILDSHPAVARVVLNDREAPRVEATWDVGVPFFVWAEVPAGWTEQPVPVEVRTYADLNTFVGQQAPLRASRTTSRSASRAGRGWWTTMWSTQPPARRPAWRRTR